MGEVCLVTGGAGFIGSHLVEALTVSGRPVRVFDNFDTGLRDNLAHIRPAPEIVHGDVADADMVLAVMAGANVVYHLAALASVQRSVEAPASVSIKNACGPNAPWSGLATLPSGNVPSRPRLAMPSNSVPAFGVVTTATCSPENHCIRTTPSDAAEHSARR